MSKSVRDRFIEVQNSLDEVHGLVDSNTPSDLNKAATILKSLLPIYKDLTNNEESKRPENLEVLKEIKSRLTEETQRVMSKKEEAKNLQQQQQQQMEQQLRQQQQQQIMESTSRSRAFTSPELPKPPLLSGYLKKQGDKGLVKSFKKRWFQQRESKLFYYEKEGDKEAYGFINLPDMIGVKTVDSGFELATPTRVYIFQVLKPSDLNYWTEGLKDYKKYYQSLQNSQKVGGDNTSPTLASSNSYSDFRSVHNGVGSTQNTPIIDRRGTVSGAMFTPQSTSENPTSPNFISTSYNPADEELKRRENEILKRHQQQQQQQPLQQQQTPQIISEDYQSPQQTSPPNLSRQQSHSSLSRSQSQSQINNLNDSDQQLQQQQQQQQQQINQSPQQSPYNSRHGSYNYQTTPINQFQQPSLSQPSSQHGSINYNNLSNNTSPKIESYNGGGVVQQSTYQNENQNSYNKLNLESFKQSIEEELKKKFIQEKAELLDIEMKKRQELENEIKRTKDLLEKSQLESHQKSVTANIDLKNKNQEIEELKAQVNVFTEKNETLQEKIRELESIKPIETFPHEFLWTEEVTSRDQKILGQLQRIRELEESLKLKDNAVAVIKRENELLRHETEKKDKYINELLENNKNGGGYGGANNKQIGSSSGSSGANRDNDITKIKESLAAHQTQNSFLLQEIKSLETQNQFKLDLKLQQIEELQQQMEEQLYQFHRFREAIIGTMSNEYCNKLEKENLDLKKEYFQCLGVSIKLHRLREGDPVNIDIHSLFDKAIKDGIHYRDFPEFLNKQLKQL